MNLSLSTGSQNDNVETTCSLCNRNFKGTTITLKWALPEDETSRTSVRSASTKWSSFSPKTRELRLSAMSEGGTPQQSLTLLCPLDDDTKHANLYEQKEKK